jgi:hypothetical protein
MPQRAHHLVHPVLALHLVHRVLALMVLQMAWCQRPSLRPVALVQAHLPKLLARAMGQEQALGQDLVQACLPQLLGLLALL